MESGFGRWSICHGGYSGYVTNASHGRGHREDKEPCNEKSSLGEFLGNRCHTIKAQGEEIRAKMKLRGTPNRFLTIPPIIKEVWDHDQIFYCRTLALSVLRPEKKKDGKKDENPRTYQIMMQEIYKMSSTKPLHIWI
jgi:hypothetical protein